MSGKIKVAVAGASGIGKHHAKWYHRAGCEVVAFWGRNQASCASTERALKEILPFAGRAYWDLPQMLDQEQPDLVDISLPNELHFDCAWQALEAGCHVLCEKPLVWDDGPSAALLEKGQRLIDKARENGRQLGVCTQYAASLPHYGELHSLARGPVGPIHSFYAEMETLARGRQRDAATVWLDMGPHPLSLLLSWVPEGRLDPHSLQVQTGQREVTVRFDFITATDRCRSEIVVRDVEDGQPVRRFGVNGFVAHCEGRADEEGEYRAVLRHNKQEIVGTDFMELLIRQCVAAIEPPVVDKEMLVRGEAGLRNLELQLQILTQVT
ncbi:MAG: hypothetical protein GKR89_36470 [Candidatus Latescibacteria bacterium]|nr:hypothetical protein [Candidatus Latescibacterota bacterium]